MYDFVPINETYNIIKHRKSFAINLSCINHQTRSQNKSQKYRFLDINFSIDD